MKKDDISKDFRKNNEGYPDPTAYEAVKRIEKRSSDDIYRLDKLLKTIFDICELSGFHVEERIVLRDTRSGRIFR